MKKDIYILAHDYSGSTNGVNFFFVTALHYLKRFMDNTSGLPNVRYLLWGTKSTEIDQTRLLEIYERMEGREGTQPAVIPRWIIDNQMQAENIHLWLITDGEIIERHLMECKSLNFCVNYKSINLITINQNTINNSISFAFFNNDCSITMYDEIGNSLKKVDLKTTDYDFEGINLDNFTEKFENITDFIVSKFTINSAMMNIPAEQKFKLEEKTMAFIENLKMLKEKLLKEFRDTETDKSENFHFKNINILESRKVILDKIKEFPFYLDQIEGIKSVGQIIVQRIDSMISFIHSKKIASYVFGDLKKMVQQQKFDERSEVVSEELPEVVLQELSDKVNFQDCLSLSNSDFPIICMSLVSYIFEFAEKNYRFLIQMIDYPLVLIENKDFLKKNSFICQTYDCETFKEYIKHNNGGFPIIDPMTRSELIGGIIPYEFANAWNDYSISCIFFNGKKIKRSFYDLFYFVLYKKLEVIENIDRSVLHQLQIYSFDRIKKGRSKLTFSSLPLEPKDIVPIPIALLYCVQISSEMFGEDPNFYKLEKLRNFCFTSEYIIEILRYFKMDIDEDFIRKKSELFQTLIRMKGLDDYKRLEFILGKIFKVEDGYLINEIVAPEKLHMLAYLDQNMTNIVSLKETTLESIQERTLFYYLSLDPEPYTICEETCRPKYMVDGEPFYNKLLKDLFKFKVNKNMIEAVQIKSMEDLEFPEMLSMCKIFISFVVANKEYPTLAEYKEFLLKNKKSYHATKEVKKLCIFPSVIIRDLKKIHDYYEPITKKMSPKIFIERARNSFFVEDKVKIENSIFSVLK